MDKLNIRYAKKEDTKTILNFIKELAEYEDLIDEVVADEETLEMWLFEKEKAEVIIASVEGIDIGFALFFHNFSTFLGKSGLYLEDLYIKEEYRHKGHGKKMFSYLANIAKERNCGRFEWSCLDNNTPSIEFYLSMDAVAMDEWTVYRLTEEKFNKLVNK